MNAYSQIVTIFIACQLVTMAFIYLHTIFLVSTSNE